VAVTVVLDTNTILYYLRGRLIDPLPVGDILVSTVTEIELLSYGSIPQEDEDLIHEFLQSATLVDLEPAVRAAAIQLRRQHRLKLPDAVIGGTAIAFNAELLTNDAHLLRVPDLTCRQMRLKAP
jgi:predicted nucleic acid-binding protein